MHYDIMLVAKFVAAYAVMRRAQKAFFNLRSKDNLIAAKAAERECDVLYGELNEAPAPHTDPFDELPLFSKHWAHPATHVCVFEHGACTSCGRPDPTTGAST